MSDLPTTSEAITHQDHKRQLQYAPYGGGATSSAASHHREYRKGNWTLQETLVLITAKRLDNDRRTKPGPIQPSSRTGELRWKWVENYCWANGCLRSQNQCNDKWDNLLREFKKVREYELRSSQTDGSDQSSPSYWVMDKQARKDRNLPCNMAAEVYDALKEVVQMRCPQRTIAPPQPPAPPPSPPPPPLPALPVMAETAAPPAVPETSDSSETDSSGRSDLEKQPKVLDIGSSIVQSASTLARTLKSCEEKKEKRHRQMMEMEERRLRAKETRNEVNREGLSGLVAALGNLSSAIHSLVSGRPGRS
ncbi:hypothetical protein NMG60_11030706 [Bertholletia excelsa]